ncbi:MAG: hotdog fold thioesterase [Streptosporangiales bacterium]|nr:hotdog fold thioesterase [Streptosporangiales bacterium]
MGPFNDWLGFVFEEATGERVDAVWTVREEFLQPFGILHGGIHCSIAEALASLGGSIWFGDAGRVVGVTNSTDFYRAISAGALRSVAVPVHRGRVQQVWDVKTHDQAEGRLIARAQVRLQNLPHRDHGVTN